MKITIAGYYGFGNIGDELILSTLIGQLKKKYPNALITVLSVHPSQTKTNHAVSSVNRWNLLSVLRTFWSTDLFILGGGGLIQDGTSVSSLLYYLGLIGLARMFHSAVALYAVGVEKLETKWGRRAVQFMLGDRSIVLTVRDNESKLILEGIGIAPDRIHVTGDPVFAHGIISSTFSRYASKVWSVLFIPRFSCPPEGQKLYGKIVEILKVNRGLNVKVALFQPLFEQSQFEKSPAAKNIAVSDRLVESTPEKFLNEVPRFDFVVSARFHGLVMAALSGRPFLGLGDPEKVGRFCRAWDQPFLPWNATHEQIETCLALLLSNQSNPKQNNLEDWRKAANRTIEFV